MAQEAAKVGTWQEFELRILPRIAAAGYNTIQIMGVLEHPYYGSFGYHVSSFFAPSSRFGTPEEFKSLVDAAHALGLGRDGLVSMERLFELLALNPSRLLGIDSGQLIPGAPADVILFDPGTPWQIDATKFVGQAGNTPFDKIPVQGRVISTIKGGRILG